MDRHCELRWTSNRRSRRKNRAFHDALAEPWNLVAAIDDPHWLGHSVLILNSCCHSCVIPMSPIESASHRADTFRFD